MSSWNHRLVRRHDGGDTWIEVTEVLYRDGRPTTFVENYIPRTGTVSEMRDVIARMRVAMARPILDEKMDFPATPIEA